MSGMASLVKFVAGSAVGATIGASIGLLLAPKSGEQLQAETAAYMDNLKSEGELARQRAEAEMAERFRQKVDDPTAFTQET